MRLIAPKSAEFAHYPRKTSPRRSSLVSHHLLELIDLLDERDVSENRKVYRYQISNFEASLSVVSHRGIATSILQLYQ